MIAIIAAVANGNVIGYKGKMPWEDISLDHKHFKERTMRSPVVMGYSTAFAISKRFPHGNMLPGRTSFVLTHEPRKVTMLGAGCIALTSTDFVFEMAKTECVYVIGGANVYRQFIGKADIIHITRIDADFEGDTFFPSYNLSDWRKLYSDHACDCGYNLCFETLARGHKCSEVHPDIFRMHTPADTARVEVINRLSC